MGQLNNLATMGTWLGQTYREESEKKKRHENQFLIKYMLQGEIKKKQILKRTKKGPKSACANLRNP